MFILSCLLTPWAFIASLFANVLPLNLAVWAVATYMMWISPTRYSAVGMPIVGWTNPLLLIVLDLATHYAPVLLSWTRSTAGDPIAYDVIAHVLIWWVLLCLFHRCDPHRLYGHSNTLALATLFVTGFAVGEHAFLRSG